MHELALAEAVITTALEVAEKENMSAVTRIDVRIGELQHIKKEVFEFALQEVMPQSEPRLSATEFQLEIEPARFRCRACRHPFAMDSGASALGADEAEAIHFVPELAHAFLRCPACRSPDFEVVQGRGLMIETIEGERD